MSTHLEYGELYLLHGWDGDEPLQGRMGICVPEQLSTSR